MLKTTNFVIFIFLLAFIAVSGLAGNKYGVFIGINDYPEPITKLKGCANDARKWRNLVKTEFGMSESNSDILLDAQATRANIINTIKKYQNIVSAGDVFIVSYSGHGTLFPDSKSEIVDESDQIQVPAAEIPLGTYDSAICPFDTSQATSGKPWRNLILDDELYELFSVFTAKGAVVYYISDSCHSGTIARGLGGNSMNPDNLGNNSNVIRRFAPPLKALNISSFASISAPRNQRTEKQRQLPSNLLLVLAGSQDNQFSLDVTTNSGRQGLFTASFVEQYQAIKAVGGAPTFAKVMEKTRPFVENYSLNIPTQGEKVPQTPRFDARFFCGTLDIPLFSFPNCGETAASSVKVVAKITDAAGNAITGVALGLLKFGTNVNPNGIRAEDAVLLGRSDANGFYNSKEMKVPAGRYLVKVIKTGYKPFIQQVEITDSKDGVSVLAFKLVKE